MKWTCIIRTAGGYVMAEAAEDGETQQESWDAVAQAAMSYDEGWNLVSMTQITDDPITLIDGKEAARHFL